jgi:sphinganine C4-monooxygenase
MSHNISSQMGTWFASGDPLSTLDLSPQKLEYPFYFKQSVSILPWISDKYLSLLLPIVCYWGFSLFYQILDIVQLPFFEKYRLHEPAEVLSRNRVSKKRVVAMVVLQQFIQTILGMCVLEDDETVYKQVFTDHRAHMRTIGVYLARAVVKVAGMKSGIKLLDAYGTPTTEFLYWWGLPALQFFWAL